MSQLEEIFVEIKKIFKRFCWIVPGIHNVVNPKPQPKSEVTGLQRGRAPARLSDQNLSHFTYPLSHCTAQCTDQKSFTEGIQIIILNGDYAERTWDLFMNIKRWNSAHKSFIRNYSLGSLKLIKVAHVVKPFEPILIDHTVLIDLSLTSTLTWLQKAHTTTSEKSIIFILIITLLLTNSTLWQGRSIPSSNTRGKAGFPLIC